MRKQNKIVSLVLVLALLLGVFVVIPTTPAVASAAGESFTPSMTETESPSTADVLNATKLGETSSWSGVAGSDVGVMYYLVTDTASGNKYFELRPGASLDVETEAHQHYNWFATSTNVAYEENSFLVFSFDYYAEAAHMTDAYIGINSRNKESGSDGGTAFTINSISGKLPIGEWARVTCIGDVAENKLYVYVNGELATTVNSGVHNSSAFDGHQFQSVRLNVNTRKNMNASQSLAVDNFYIDVNNTDSWLSANKGASSLSAWTNAPAHALPTVPALAKVDGTTVYTLAELNALLTSHKTVNVELLRPYIGTVTVNCDAIVETHGVANLTAGTNVTTTANGTVLTYDAPWKASATETTTQSWTNMISSTTGNLVDGTSLINWDDASVLYNTVTAANGSVYAKLTSLVNKPTQNHFVNWSVAKQVLNFESGYYVVELDVAADGATLDNLTIAPIITWAGSTSYTDRLEVGNGVQVADIISADGAWHHIAVIGDLVSNNLYIYVDGELKATKANTAYNTANKKADTEYYVGNVRLNIDPNLAITANTSIAVDNFSVKTYDSIGDGYVYGTAPAEKQLPVLATVNGEDVYSTTELSAKLIGNTAKNVELYRAYNGTITVNCDATVETHGFLAPTAGENVTVSNDGTVYTYDAPYMESLIMSDLVTDYKDIITETKSNVDGNLFYNMQYSKMTGKQNVDEGSSTNGIHASGFIGTNTISGDKYFIYDGTGYDEALGFGVTGESNTYFEYQSFTKVYYDASQAQYMVYDFDYAQMTEGTVAYSIVPRNASNSGQWGANNVSLSAATANYALGEFHHVTYVYDMNNNVVYVYVNGNLVTTKTNGVTSAENFDTYKAGNGAYLDMNGIRLGANSTAIFATDNVAIRLISETAGTTADGTLTKALSGTNLGAWDDAITAAESEIAPFATVDGEYVATAAQLAAALDGRKVKNVEILRSETAAVTVNCDAVIETNGLNVNLVAGTNVTVTTNGTVKTYDAPWKASATEQSGASPSVVIDNNATDNLFIDKGSSMYIANNDENELELVKVTDNETGNVYVKLQPLKNGATINNVYITTEVANAVVPYSSGYVVYDLKLATDSTLINAISIDPVMRKQSTGGGFPFGQSVPLGKYVTDADEWMHFTLVADLAANTQYVFVNGALVGTAGYAKQDGHEDTNLLVRGFRLNLSKNVVISTDESLLIDDMSLRVYTTSDELAAAITAGTLADWNGNLYDGTNEKLPVIATVDGKEYYSATALEAALSAGKNHKVSLDRNLTGSVVANSTATVTTNGLANFLIGAPGYNTIDNGDGTYSIVVESRYGVIVVNINGKEAIRKSVLYGTDIADYLNKTNSYVAGAIAADNGDIYYGLTWESTPTGLVNGDATYSVTGTEFVGEAIVIEANGTVNEMGDVFSSNFGWDHKRDISIILGKDFVFNSQATPVDTGATKTIYLNGHTLSFGTGGASAHAMTLNGTTNVKFVGGNIVDNVRANTQAVVYADYEFSGSVSFVNCNVYAVATIATMRGGTLNIENCNINVLEAQATNGIQLAEYYNAGYTYNKVTLNLVNTDVRFVHALDGKTATFITIKDFSEWSIGNGENDAANRETARAKAIAAGADKLAHEINISGCTVYNDYSAAFINSTNNLVNISIDNTQLNVKKMFNGAKGNITIGANVLSAVKLSNLGAGIVEVNSGNPVAPYLYTDNYATVIWADGTVERWADGSYPVNADYSKANVPMVEAGNTYNVGDNVTVDIAMKANLSLGANLKLNVYVPTYVNLTAFNIAGVVYSVADAVLIEINGTECYYFGYEMAPHLATGDYTLAATVGETTITKSINLVEYANLVMAQYSEDANAQNLIKAILNYVAAAGKHMGAYTQGYDAANGYADAAAIAVDTSNAVNTMANVSAYLTGASLDLNAAPAWAFTVANGADISDLVITVNGNNVNYTVVGGKVIVELRAYDMLDTITVEVGGVSGEYNFAAYYAAMKTLADSASFTNSKAGSLIKEAEAYRAMTLLDAFYTYASYAVAYK